MKVEGLRVLQSRHDPAGTLERLEVAIVRSGFKLFGRIDHGAEAEAAGIDMLLIWQDEKGLTRLACNDPAWLLGRHGAADDANVETVNEVLANVAGQAVA